MRFHAFSTVPLNSPNTSSASSCLCAMALPAILLIPTGSYQTAAAGDCRAAAATVDCSGK